MHHSGAEQTNTLIYKTDKAVQRKGNDERNTVGTLAALNQDIKIPVKL